MGWIEIGQNEMISAFVRAYGLGGTVYEGEDSYPSMEAALQDLEAGIKAYLDDIADELRDLLLEEIYSQRQAIHASA